MAIKKGFHKTKDGRIVKKGLYYNMNQAKKKGTSKKGKGTVTDKALIPFPLLQIGRAHV